MNEVRKHTEKEEPLASTTLRLPVVIYLLYAVIEIILFVNFVMLLSQRLEVSGIPSDKVLVYVPSTWSIIFPLILMLIIGILFAIKVSQMANCRVIISNKRIYGVKLDWFVSRRFSYKLDSIVGMENYSALGINYIKIKFDNGNINPSLLGNQQTIKIKYVEDLANFTEEIEDLLTSIKNDKDILLDVKLTDIATLEEQNVAIEKIAKK